MWLIDTHTLKLKFFHTCPEGQYAILSHVWGDEEMSFSEFQAWDGSETGRTGLVKILKCCEKARDLKLAYAWVDTCCIDKSSSAELSEAINSMYQWYAKASVCFAYLFDVERESTIIDWNTYMQFGHPLIDDACSPGPAFSCSRWFTRGWTLQELIAPREVLFFSCEWSYMFPKTRIFWHLQGMTGINAEVMLHAQKTNEISISSRMSWMIDRTTTRTEDMAYCLLGIFDVNMPLLYGEGGEKAFVRLQQAILSVTDDESIFAWSGVSRQGSGMLAPHPSAFRGFENVVPISTSHHRPAYSMTNKGLSIDAQLWTIAPNVYLMPLSCTYSFHRVGNPFHLGLILSTTKNGRYTRTRIVVGGAEDYDVALAARPSGESETPRPLSLQKIPVRSTELIEIPVFEPPDPSLVTSAQICISDGPVYRNVDANPPRIRLVYSNPTNKKCMCSYRGGTKLYSSGVLPPPDLSPTGWHKASVITETSIHDMKKGLDIVYGNAGRLDSAFDKVRIGFDFDMYPICMFPAGGLSAFFDKHIGSTWFPPSLFSLHNDGTGDKLWSRLPFRLDSSTYCLRGDKVSGLDTKFVVQHSYRYPVNVHVKFIPNKDHSWLFHLHEEIANAPLQLGAASPQWGHGFIRIDGVLKAED